MVALCAACSWLMASFRRAAGPRAGQRVVSASSQAPAWMGASSGRVSRRRPMCSATWAKYRTSIVVPVATFASGFAEQADLLDDDAFVCGLAHVVDRQCSHGAGRHGLHLDAGLVAGAAGGADGQGMAGLVGRGIHPHETERQAVTQRDQLGAAFCRQDAGDAGGVQDLAFGVGLGGQQPPGMGVQADPALGDGGAVGGGLGADIDHADLAVFVQMAEGGGLFCVVHEPMINEDAAAGMRHCYDACLRSRSRCGAHPDIRMAKTIGAFFSLYLASLVLLLSSGLFNTYLGLRLTALSVSEVWVGAMIAAYYLGLVLGARVG